MRLSHSSIVLASLISSTLSSFMNATLANESTPLSARQSVPPPVTGIGSDGYYYYSWKDASGYPQSTFENQDQGAYTFTWSGNGGSIGGKGWNPGTADRVIGYNGEFKPNGNAFLSVYGWTRNPLVKYYIMDSFGSSYSPDAGNVRKGTVSCNGGTYQVSATWRYNADSIDGTQTYQEIWSLRSPKRNPGASISGTVDVACHFNAWKNLGLGLGTEFDYQIVATEGYFSSGTSTMTVSDVGRV